MTAASDQANTVDVAKFNEFINNLMRFIMIRNTPPACMLFANKGGQETKVLFGVAFWMLWDHVKVSIVGKCPLYS